MGWIKTHALIVALVVIIALMGALGVIWRGWSRADARAEAAEKAVQVLDIEQEHNDPAPGFT